MKKRRIEEEKEMLKKEADRAKEPRQMDLERIEELEAEVERLRSVMEDAAHTVMNKFPPTRAREQTARILRNALDAAEDGQL